MNRIAILTYNHAALFELACAVELFCLPRPEFDCWYQGEVVSFERGVLNVNGGVQILANQVNSLQSYSTLIIPSWPTEDATANSDLAGQICGFHAAGKRIIAFCSGAFLLAELGILNGCKATTHWRYADKFRDKYPDLSYVEDVLYVYDGQVGTSAGSAAAIDLGIEVIRRDYGYQIANQVARRLVMSAHRNGGQSQFVETPILQAPNQFAESLDWALSNLTSNININAFAAKARMSRRTFDRKFRSTFDLTPKEWLTTQRLNKAKELLESRQCSVDQVAELSGFETAVTMRHHFRRVLGVSPKQYRQQFTE